MIVRVSKRWSGMADRAPDLRITPQAWDNFNNLVALRGTLSVGDIEQGGIYVVFSFARAETGAPVMTLSMEVVAAGVPIELADIMSNDPFTSVVLKHQRMLRSLSK